MTEPSDTKALLQMTTEIAASYLANNTVRAGDIPGVINDIAGALRGIAQGTEAAALTPAVPVRSSVKPDHLVCLECGKKQRILKRHLQTAHRLTPAQYRERWSLKADYPMVAPNYSKRRSEMAKQIGLGQRRRKR